MRASRIAFDPTSGVTAHLILSQSDKRVGLILFPPVGGTAVLSNDPNPSGNNGLTLQQGQAPIHLYAEACGDVVGKEWYVLYSAGASVMGWIEVLY